jgi:very-short-patch-repair endonuclease
VAARADGLAESPQETRLRLLFSREGLPAPVARFRVFGNDGSIARVDVAYPELELAIEYDGAWHGEREQFAEDRRRLNRLVAAGWVVLHVTAAEMRDPTALGARIRALMTRQATSINAR